MSRLRLYLVNNAGISHIGLLIDMTDNEWDRLLASNLSSAFYCSREALKDMVSDKSGRILNISSMWGTVGASCEAAYSAVKSGMNGLTKALAKEYAPSHIAVNALACGVIDTEMNHQLSSEENALHLLKTFRLDDLLTQMKLQILHGRLLTVRNT